MTAESLTVAFGDPRAERYGMVRAGLAPAPDGGRRASVLVVLFAGREPVAALARGNLPLDADASLDALRLPGLELEAAGVRFDAGDGHGFALALQPLGEPAEVAAGERLAGVAVRDEPCRVRGIVSVGGREQEIEALGQRARVSGDPDWRRVALSRTVAAWTDEAAAALTVVRPVEARHHADEAAWGALWESGTRIGVADARLSTTYDDAGRTRRAGLELWPDGEGDDGWPRRAAGEALCGSTLELGALRLDCAFFRWHLEGRPGVGRYDVLRPAA